MKGLSFCAWLILRSDLSPSTLLQMIGFHCFSQLSRTELDTILYFHLSPSLIVGHLGGFQSLAIVKSAAMNKHHGTNVSPAC